MTSRRTSDVQGFYSRRPTRRISWHEPVRRVQIEPVKSTSTVRDKLQRAIYPGASSARIDRISLCDNEEDHTLDRGQQQLALATAIELFDEETLFKIANEFNLTKSSQRLRFWQDQLLIQLGDRIGSSLSGVEDYIEIFGDYVYESNVGKAVVKIVSDADERAVFVSYLCGEITESGNISGYAEHLEQMAKLLTRDDVISLYSEIATEVGKVKGPWRNQFAEAFGNLITVDELDFN